MKIINKGKNYLYINNVLFVGGDVEVIISSNMTQDKKIMEYKITLLNNVFQLYIELVDLNKEKLIDKLIYLDYGTHKLTIKQYNKEKTTYIEYTDILYYSGDVLEDDVKYTKTKQNQRIYKKQ